MTARDDVLGRVRTALAGTADVPLPDLPPDPLADVEPERALATFVDRILDYRAHIDRVDAGTLAGAVARACADRGIGRLLVPDGVPAEWTAVAAEGGVELVPDGPERSAVELDRLDAVLTGCAVAIAESGTIVLDGGSDQGRRAASLVPDVHLCVVRTDQVVPSVPAALPHLDPRAPMTWISGGSATSDIELQRVEGVHGPRTLHVLLVD